MMKTSCFVFVALLASSQAFSTNLNHGSSSIQQSQPARFSKTALQLDRRSFGFTVAGAAASLVVGDRNANAEVFFDPAMYGDQELRVGTVDSVRERTRRAILQDPRLAPSFYQLALLDGLSFNSDMGSMDPMETLFTQF